MKKINKYIKIGLLSFSLMGLVSCNDFLEKSPDNRMNLSSKEDVASLLVSAYPDIYPAYLLEMYSDNTDEYRNTAYGAADRFQIQAYSWEDIDATANDGISNLWQKENAAISTANLAIEFINQQADKEAYSAQLGEALLCRAYAVFTLTNIFCQAYDATTAEKNLGIYYAETVDEHVGIHHERGTLAETYKKIEEDILKGISLVGNTYDHPKFHFTKNAAYAFAARFFLYYQKYEDAVKYATLVLGSNPAANLRDWQSWNTLSANDNVQPNAYISSTNNANILLQTVYSDWGMVCGAYGYGDKYTHGRLISETETLEADGPWGNSSTVMGYKVFSNDALARHVLRKVPALIEYINQQTGSGYLHSEFAAFTMDETLMVRAEAYALLHQYDKALADINAELSKFTAEGVQLSLAGIKQFYDGISYYTPENPTPKKKLNTIFPIDQDQEEPLLQGILQLKRLVTIHEGIRMQDIKRYGIEIYRRRINMNQQVEAVTDVLTKEDPRRAIQLPQDVITAGMTPNPRNK